MVIDYAKCVRYARGDEHMATPLVPYRCPVCARGVSIRAKDEEDNPIEARLSSSTPRSYSGKLGPIAEAGKRPTCDDHNMPVEMERI